MSTALRTYYRGHNLVAMRDEQATVNRYYHFDHQGTTQCLTDNGATVTDRFASDAWGVQVKRSGSSPNALWYAGNTGYCRDADNRLAYVRARYLNMVNGRWLTRDAGEDDMPYAYARNRVVLLTDASGLAVCAPTNCCLFYNLGKIQQRIADGGLAELCKDGSWGSCPQFDSDGRKKLAEACDSVAAQKTNCSLLDKRLDFVSVGCYTSCQSNSPPQDDEGFRAAAWTVCCRDTIQMGETRKPGKCKYCVTYCCDAGLLGELEDPCARMCLYEHEDEHKRQCEANQCTKSPFDINSNLAAKSECGGYWKEAQCLADLMKKHNCPISPDTQRRLNDCNIVHRRRFGT